MNLAEAHRLGAVDATAGFPSTAVAPAGVVSETIKEQAATTRTLREHRVALAENPLAYERDLDRLSRSILPHLKRCGLRGVGSDEPHPLVHEVVALLFEAQGRRPLFHVEARLPFCWNAPKDWNLDHVRYEWGHLRSRNQNEDADQLENLALCSARCNQHIQTSMDIAEVRDWLAGSRVAARIDEVLVNRERLFGSTRWQGLRAQLGALSARRRAPKPR